MTNIYVELAVAKHHEAPKLPPIQFDLAVFRTKLLHCSTELRSCDWLHVVAALAQR